MRSSTLFVRASLALLASSCIAPAETAGSLDGSLRPEVVAALEGAFVDAMLYCGPLLTDGPIRQTAVGELGDAALSRYAWTPGQRTTILDGPHAGQRPRYERDPQANPCVFAISREGGARDIDARVEDGFCRAEIAYCLGRELSLRAESLADPVSEVALEAALLRVARERFQASLVENLSSVAFYEDRCFRSDRGPWQFECNRLQDTGGGFRAQLEGRILDAVLQIERLAGREVDARVRQSEAETSVEDALDPAFAVERLWGERGHRTRALEALFGRVGTAERSSARNLRRHADMPLPTTAFEDDRARLALQLLAEMEVPLGIAGAPNGRGPLSSLGWWESELAVAAVYHLLDHRLAASLGYPPYADDTSPEAAPLLARRPLTDAELVTFATNPLPAGTSPLRSEHQLGLEDVRDALELAAELLDVQDASFERRLQVRWGQLGIFALRFDQIADRPVRLVASALAEDETATTWDAMATGLGFVPRDGGRMHVTNGYQLNLARVDSTQRVAIEQDERPPLGAAQVLHAARVHASRLASATPRFVRPAVYAELRAFVDRAIGPTWAEIDRDEDLRCECDPRRTGSTNLVPVSLVQPTVDLGVSSSGTIGGLGGSLGGSLGGNLGGNLGGGLTPITPIVPIDPILPTPIDPIIPPIIPSICTVLDPYTLPLYAPCTACGGCVPTRAEATDALHWQIVQPTDAALAGVPVAVRSYEEARCLIEDRFPGAEGPCRVVPIELEEVSARSHAPLGYLARRFRLPSPNSYASSGVNARAYVLWWSPGGPSRPQGRYELVDVVRPRNRAALHTLGGTFEKTASQLWARLPGRASRAAYKSSGVETALLPPLEGELTDDGDAFESSFAHYLREARVAAELASDQLVRARDAELEARLEDARDPLQRELAALAETEALSGLCGTEGRCDVPRIADASTLGSVGLVRATPAPELSDGASCTNVLRVVFDDFDLTDDSDDGRERIRQLGTRLETALACTVHELTRVTAELPLRGVPEVVLDEVLADGPGHMGAYDGELRDQLIHAFQALADIRSGFRRFDAQAEAVRASNRAAMERVNDANVDEQERRLCKWRMANQVIGSVASIASSIGSAGGKWQNNATSGASISREVGSLGGAVASHAHSGGCENNFGAEDRAAEATLQLARNLEAFRGVAFAARSAIVELYSRIAVIDGLAERAELVRQRRRVLERIAATDSLADLPEWRSLQAHSAQRADRSLARAVAAAHVARRAIELRFALDLSSMAEAEPFVSAPATWVDTLGDVPRALISAPDEAGEAREIGMAAEAILDYVDRLERFVEGYPFARRFRDGTDEQVLELGTLLGAPDGAPIQDLLSYQCRDLDRPLRGGFVEGAPREGREPCEDFGGVRWAELAFEIPTELRGYLRDRLVADAFNHRAEAVGLNFVGSGVLDCERARAPNECYSDGNVRYELRQGGDVMLTSFEGQRHTFAMEPGVIRAGRALTAERDLGNPMSAVDRAFVEPYLRRELRGRPLAGLYVLRVHGRPELRWSRLERIQLLLAYRYWTRQR
ncbi:MAG: hypothetical protein KF901_19450 [Myxococcales bacterium]|nr:hypothetical protein [Myxococcales bacterium]